jgi:hypothetical protein
MSEPRAQLGDLRVIGTTGQCQSALLTDRRRTHLPPVESTVVLINGHRARFAEVIAVDSGIVL